ncbi:uncharacterized protein TRUGW13939_02128 [Talaromyces rugulosus]|uniref:DUF676 domain-containing protein n=1 Tax=Talaromyces rugulosus TaxID=121627 RepID=A0A7H8QM76_TALRU|nr:uncharacterized protein TRUGW13939_02128 [Talaromyces rugulosus]QKX55037.1 hypothetical protein TRUGW13939_02128 [Talaromyces rugulosus]
MLLQSAQNSAGIQTLLDAEREAQKIVQQGGLHVFDIIYLQCLLTLIVQPENVRRACPASAKPCGRRCLDKLTRADRTKRVKEARTEAQREIDEYRKQKEDEFKKFEAEHSSGNKTAEAEAGKDAETQMLDIKEAGKKSGDKVVKDLKGNFEPPCFIAMRPMVSLSLVATRSRPLILKHGQHSFSTSLTRRDRGSATDPRFSRLGTLIEDKFADIRENYQTPKNTIVLAHGLLGFDEIRLAGPLFPPIQYWHGIKDALSMKGVKVITATVPPYGSIENRAEELVKDIAAGAKGDNVNIIAHSMIGSAIADYFMGYVNTNVTRLRKLSKSIDRIPLDARAFSQLTRTYLQDEFNPNVPNIDDVRYFSYGAMFQPGLFNIFRSFHQLLEEIEGPNDGLVSVASSKWGGDAGYKGTLVGEKETIWHRFNAIAFYLDIAGRSFTSSIIAGIETDDMANQIC